MTTNYLEEMGLEDRTIGGHYLTPIVEPSEWLDLPEPPGGDYFVGLAAINEYSTFLSFTVETNTGVDTVSQGFTVDWGNGTTTDYTSGTEVQYPYLYSTVGDYTGLYRQALVTITPKGDDSLKSLDFNVAPSEPGLHAGHNSPWLKMAISSNSLTSLSISDINMNIRHRNIEEVQINCPALTNLDYLFYRCSGLLDIEIISGPSPTAIGLFMGCRAMRNIPKNIPWDSIVDASYLFSGCLNLRGVANLSLLSTTTMAHMLEGCQLITHIQIAAPLATSVENMCFSLDFDTDYTDENFRLDRSILQEVDLLDCPNIQIWDKAFTSCKVLSTLRLDVRKGTSFVQFLKDCSDVVLTEDWEFSEGLDFSSAFDGCAKTLDLPMFTFPKATTFYRTLAGMDILRAPDWSFPKGVDFREMFKGCVYIREIDYWLPSVTDRNNLGSMAESCFQLQTFTVDSPVGMPIDLGYVYLDYIPTYGDIQYGQTFTIKSPMITKIPPIDFSNLTEGTITIQNCYELVVMQGTGIATNLYLRNCPLSAEALNNVFSALETVVNKTITILGCVGASTCDDSIATAKGWIVTK